MHLGAKGFLMKKMAASGSVSAPRLDPPARPTDSFRKHIHSLPSCLAVRPSPTTVTITRSQTRKYRRPHQCPRAPRSNLESRKITQHSHSCPTHPFDLILFRLEPPLTTSTSTRCIRARHPNLPRSHLRTTVNRRSTLRPTRWCPPAPRSSSNRSNDTTPSESVVSNPRAGRVWLTHLFGSLAKLGANLCRSRLRSNRRNNRDRNPSRASDSRRRSRARTRTMRLSESCRQSTKSTPTQSFLIFFPRTSSRTPLFTWHSPHCTLCCDPRLSSFPLCFQISALPPPSSFRRGSSSLDPLSLI